LTFAPNQRHSRSVILILVATDSFQRFLKSRGLTDGAQQPATSLITFLPLVHLIVQEQDELKKTR
jgi:hypothetical protein